jgi:hypothetical protein
MATENISIIDESGDHKYFTIIPNYILNHSTHWDREVYIQMKKIAGERGTCFAGIKKLMKITGFSKERLNNSIKYLLEHKWITFLGLKEVQTSGGKQFTNEYKINDLWKMNIEFYQKGGSPDDPPTVKGGSPNSQRGVAKGGSPDDHKEEPIKEEPSKKNQVIPIFEFWNRQGTIVHKRLTAKMETKIHSALKEYSEYDIKVSIEKYSKILKGDEYFWTYKWTLDEFLVRGLTKFLESPTENFLKEKGKKEKRQHYRGLPIIESRGKKWVVQDGQWLELDERNIDKKDISFV